MAGMLETRDLMQDCVPNTHNALTWLVPAMDRAQKLVGKRTWFGKDKFGPAYLKVLECLLPTLDSMLRDGLIELDYSDDIIEQEFLKIVETFKIAYPNWPQAYIFFQAGFVEEKNRQLSKVISVFRLRHSASLD